MLALRYQAIKFIFARLLLLGDRERILVTGASSGIGRALSEELCREGSNKVLGVGRNVENP
ncbi:MAG: SDR family NAD(P)-dependent oxidoreductase [Thermoprotei archaeon]